MRAVFTNDGTSKAWAEQNLGYGRNSTGSMYFRNKSIYSYGWHFEIARFIADDVVQLTTRSYSNTTAKHINSVRNAIPKKATVIHVPYFHEIEANLNYFIERMKSLNYKLEHARTLQRKYKREIREEIKNIDQWKKHCMKPLDNYEKEQLSTLNLSITLLRAIWNIG